MLGYARINDRCPEREIRAALTQPTSYRTEELLRQFSGMSQFLERAVASSTLSRKA